MAEKIKAINPEIIVSGDVEKRYFQIKYYDTADSTYHIGFGSYNYGNVLGWLKECFEPIAADEQPVVHGGWIPLFESEISGWNPEFAGKDPIGGYMCSVCKEEAIYDCNDEFVLSKFCPHCGAKMGEEVTDV